MYNAMLVNSECKSAIMKDGYMTASLHMLDSHYITIYYDITRRKVCNSAMGFGLPFYNFQLQLPVLELRSYSV